VRLGECSHIWRSIQHHSIRKQWSLYLCGVVWGDACRLRYDQKEDSHKLKQSHTFDIKDQKVREANRAQNEYETRR